jgi:hypothetical protein
MVEKQQDEDGRQCHARRWLSSMPWGVQVAFTRTVAGLGGEGLGDTSCVTTALISGGVFLWSASQPHYRV